jgi:hypothetical protein
MSGSISRASQIWALLYTLGAQSPPLLREEAEASAKWSYPTAVSQQTGRGEAPCLVGFLRSRRLLQLTPILGLFPSPGRL